MIHKLYTPIELCSLIAVRAKERRRALKLRQIDVAEAAGVTISTLKRFERDGRIAFEGIIAIAGALDSTEEFAKLFALPELRSIDERLKAKKLVQRVRAQQR